MSGSPFSHSVFVEGVPVTQGNLQRGKGRSFYRNDKALRAWRAAIALTVRAAGWPATDGPVAVRAWFTMPRPQAHYRNPGQLKDSAPLWHTGSRADLDKLMRAVGDALTESGVIADDGQIVVWETHKAYGSRAGVTLELEPIGAQQ